MWDDALAARIEDAGPYAFDATVAAGGRDVARVRCAINAGARCGVFGEMEVLDTSGTARQRLRALVLLVRAALAHGADLGITDVAADVPAALEAIVSRVSGMTPQVAGGRRRYRGALHAVRTRVLDETDATGNVAGDATPPGEAG